ncbi:hypothetical protein [Streptomyces sp. NBC_00557]|uniref:hypothetical protein n=1 Tax=Streptomyces sp. NBC_00557 TaxID=2975776 RepID=UPI002E806832|nr:hypothetical protein [Streptomyces sp. NBC_00557]WUC39530.1 hypothetical protein OG956_37740 [Streptomyces sp. NBC_00557]
MLALRADGEGLRSGEDELGVGAGDLRTHGKDGVCEAFALRAAAQSVEGRVEPLAAGQEDKRHAAGGFEGHEVVGGVGDAHQCGRAGQLLQGPVVDLGGEGSRIDHGTADLVGRHGDSDVREDLVIKVMTSLSGSPPMRDQQ